MKTTCKRIPIVTALLLIIPSLLWAAQYRVIRVVDGDTIVVDYKGKKEKVGLLYVITPESVHPDEKQNIPMGKVASDYTRKRLKEKNVDLEFEGPPRGRQGRLLAYVFVDGINFNLRLIKQGLSPYYTKYGLSQKYDQEFRKAERYARKHKLNIWGDPALTKKYLKLKSKWGQHKSKTRPPPASVQTKKWKYVAIRTSKTFHRVGCKWVNRISPKYLIGFNSREEAIKTGRKPCRNCRP